MTTLRLARVPDANSLHVYLNGVEQYVEYNDWEWHDTTNSVVTLPAMDAQTGDLLEVRYAHEDVLPPDPYALCVVDTFDRADTVSTAHSLGTTSDGKEVWTDVTTGGAASDFRISGNAAWSSASGTGVNQNQHVSYIDPGQPDGEVYVEGAGGRDVGIAFRLTDADPRVGFRLDVHPSASSPFTRLYVKTSIGNLTQLASDASAGSIGDNYRVVYVGTSIKAYRNGGLLFDIVNSNWLTSTKCGLYSSGSNESATSFWTYFRWCPAS